MVRMIYNIDNDLFTIHLDYLTNQLLSLLKKHNSSVNTTSNSWAFLNQDELVWTQGVSGLKDSLEKVKLENLENLCIFLPEFTVKDQAHINHVRDLLNLLRHFQGMHNIENIHILTFFMGSALPQGLMDFPNFDKIFFYTLALSNELSKYPSFISSHKSHLSEDDLSLEHKLEVFKQKGSLNSHLCY